MGRRWSLRARFVLVATACLLPLVLVVLFVLFENRPPSSSAALDIQIAAAEIAAQALGSTLTDTEAMLQELAGQDALQRVNDVKATETLAIFRRARPKTVYGLFLIASDGRVVARAGLEPGVMPTGLDPALTRALGPGELGVSNVMVLDDRTEVIAFIVPVWDRDQAEEKPVAAVGALLQVDKLRDTVLPFARGEMVIGIVAEGQIIAARAATDLAAADLRDRLAEPVSHAVAGTVGTYVYEDATGVERLAAYAPVPGAEWAVVVTHPSPKVQSPTEIVIQRGLVALGVAFLVAILLVTVLSEWVARPLRLLTTQAATLAKGDFSQRVTPVGGGEINTLGVAFQNMADQLAAQLQDLELARQAGATQAEQMRDLNRRTIRLQEDERRRIAGDIHDAVNPLVTGALYQARALRLAAGGCAVGKQHGNGDQTTVGLDAISDLLTRAMAELHGVIFSLRPPDLDDLGVEAAIERYIAQIQRSGLACQLIVTGDTPMLTPEVRLAVYRIVQEALHNALRHAAADEAVVRLETADGLLRVTIRDNGAGFDPEAASRPTALGLLSMRERAAAIGATLTVVSRPGDGTMIMIERRMEPEHAVPSTEPPATENGGRASTLAPDALTRATPVAGGEGLADDFGSPG